MLRRVPIGPLFSLLMICAAGAVAIGAREAAAQPAATPELTFDLTTIPFSRAGAYLAISRLPKADNRPAGLYLRTVRANPANQNIFVLEPLVAGKPIATVERVSPSRIHLDGPAGAGVDLVFAESKVLRIRGRGMGLRLRMLTVTPVNSTYPGEGPRWVVNNSPNGVKLMVTPLQGRIAVDAPWTGVKSERIAIDLLPDEAGNVDVALEEYKSAWRKRGYDEVFDAAHARVASEFRSFADAFPAVGERHRAAAELAKYLLWSNLVDPDGILTRTSMFMSKNHMTGVWSWDHCFNAMALAEGHPALAWDQFAMFFDLQDRNGGLPDRVNDRQITWAHNKPPVHGWALRHMMARSPYFRDKRRLASVYGPLARWTDWWFTFRDDDGDGLPQYNHGNDSGWDNATPFLGGVPLEMPDLPAFLAIQMDVLAEIATKIGKPADARRWRARADALIAQMLRTFWKDDHFVAFRSGSDAPVVTKGDSLILFLPIVLGQRLPAPVRERLLADLQQEGRFLTKHGLATENPRSPLYEPDGYWRGPIWAPSTMLFVDGITAAGQAAFAQDLATRFVNALSTSQMPENFDALTGKDRRDPGYTWTSSVYLMLARKPAR